MNAITPETQELDETIKRVMLAADVKTKWRVKRRTKAWRKPDRIGDLGYIAPDTFFYSNWQENGYVSIHPLKWVLVADCEVINEQEPPIPVPNGQLVYLYHDKELPPGLLKKERNNVPQTVKFIHYHSKGNIRYTDDLIDFILAINPSLTRDELERLSDAWNRQNEKFRDGERKFPFELGFGGNTHKIIRRFIWAGGLNIPKGRVMIELDRLHPDNLPEPSSILDTPYIVHCNTVAGVNVNPFRGRKYPPVLSALISPVPLYIEEARCRYVAIPPNPYCPAYG